jgi:hypothetical protein
MQTHNSFPFSLLRSEVLHFAQTLPGAINKRAAVYLIIGALQTWRPAAGMQFRIVRELRAKERALGNYTTLLQERFKNT